MRKGRYAGAHAALPLCPRHTFAGDVPQGEADDGLLHRAFRLK